MGFLDGRRVAFVATDGVEMVELTEPWTAVEQAGAVAEMISIERGEIQGYDGLEKAGTFRVDGIAAEANAGSYDALVLPGGLANPDALRRDENVIGFVCGFFEEGKPVAAVCHAPWVLIEADVVRGRRLTSFPSIATDVRNAGGVWVDEAVCVDGGLVTSRSPADLEPFCAGLVEAFARGPHERQTESIAPDPPEGPPGLRVA
jgi:protease I